MKDQARRECIGYLEATTRFSKEEEFVELKHLLSTLVPSIRKPPNLELKELPSYLRYATLGDDSTLPVIIFSSLIRTEEEKLLRVLRDHKAVGPKVTLSIVCVLMITKHIKAIWY